MQTVLEHLTGQIYVSPGEFESEPWRLQWTPVHCVVLNASTRQREVLERECGLTVSLRQRSQEVSAGWLGKLVGRQGITQHLLEARLRLPMGELCVVGRSPHPGLLEGLAVVPPSPPVEGVLRMDFPVMMRWLESLCHLGAQLEGGMPLPPAVSAIQRLRVLEAEHAELQRKYRDLERSTSREKDQLSILKARDNSRTIEMATLRAELDVVRRSGVLPAVTAEEGRPCPRCASEGAHAPVDVGVWQANSSGRSVALALCSRCWQTYAPS